MAAEVPVLTRSYKAAADLSTKQYYFVKFTAADTVGVCAAATDVPCGVLQNAPDAANKGAEVMHLGISKVNSDAALTLGLLIGTAADGQADAKTAGDDPTEYTVGVVIEASAVAGGYATALINCLSPHRSA